MHLLFAQSEYPEALRRDALLSNLKPSLHKKVLLSIPSTAAEVVEHAVCIETQECGSRTVERLKEWENSQSMASSLVWRLAGMCFVQGRQASMVLLLLTWPSL